MSELDQFESVFRSAVRSPYVYQSLVINKVLLVTDLDQEGADELLIKIRRYLSIFERESPEWEVFTGDRFKDTVELLELVEKEGADLICTYRNLHSHAWRMPHSLGEFVDVLLQKTDAPVMLIPHPHAEFASSHALRNTDKVMAMTDHLDQDHRLVNAALHFTQDQGSLYLVHIEDQVYFERIVEALSKIPTIDTETAAASLRKQLLKQPSQYIESCKQVLGEKFPSIHVKDIVDFGHRLQQFKHYIDEYKVDLLALHTKDDDQLAMHGLVYPLAVELRQIPLLML